MDTTLLCVDRKKMTQAEFAAKLSVSANMQRSKFYTCPVCGNVIHSMGEAVINCHGAQLIPLEL